MIAPAARPARQTASPTIGQKLLRFVVPAAALVFLAGWVAAAKLSDLLLPMGTDQGLFSLIGLAILRGELPYLDIWDNKPPGLYYAYAAVLAWFPGHAVDCAGPFLPAVEGQVRLPCGHLGTMLLDSLFSAGVCLGLFGFGRLLGNWRIGALAAAFFLVFAVQAPLGHGGAKPELLVLLPETLTFALLWQHLRSKRYAWLLLTGLCLGLALLIKQTAAAAGLAALALVAADGLTRAPRTRWITMALGVGSLGLGVALPLLPVVLYFWSHQALGELVYAVVSFNLAYARSPEESLLARAVSGSWRVFRDSQALLWLLALSGLLRLMPRALSQPSARLLCGWVLADAAAVSMGGGRFYSYYYLQLVPSLALVAAVGLVAIWRHLGLQAGRPGGSLVAARRLWLGMSLAAVLSLSVPVQVHVLLRTLHERVRAWVPSEAERAAAAVRRSPPGALVVWGDASQVYVLAGREPGSRFVHGVAVSERWTRSGQTTEHRNEFLADMRRRRPVLFAVDPWTEREDPSGSLQLNLRSFPALQAMLEGEYAPSTADSGSFDLYVRQDAARAERTDG